ncbi:hypothetical protein Y1Q_0014001 [Alligator mississippiensis]|uniref:Uncharacterized protein n=1 Tax=Alligator mississippiensis TaxID=8496 RepID=A0A151PDA7_ALLMI|nr:hypothetical protein Y1Q_0014001 [Alligator mississippiensis]
MLFSLTQHSVPVPAGFTATQVSPASLRGPAGDLVWTTPLWRRPRLAIEDQLTAKVKQLHFRGEAPTTSDNAIARTPPPSAGGLCMDHLFQWCTQDYILLLDQLVTVAEKQPVDSQA